MDYWEELIKHQKFIPNSTYVDERVLFILNAMLDSINKINTKLDKLEEKQ